ncbi:MAG: hypothetical protein HRU15_11460, partial [Planctomycetes bacterium]|nr:hypothetical protein [Planctomycetota bacterium]
MSVAGNFETVRAAPGKINIFLRILDRRGDGFHNLETVFQTISLADVVRVRCSPGAHETCVRYFNSERVDSNVDFGDQDLAYRAVQAYRDYCGTLQNVDITIDKQIPVSAGLAGGSSDAAAVLRALQESHPIEQKLLQEIALSLGSDVPFFLLGGTAFATGRGEQCLPLDDLAEKNMFLVTP